MEIESLREERHRLAQAVDTLDSEILSLRVQLSRGKDVAPVSGEAAVTWRQDAMQRLEALALARSNPYFGRIDLASPQGETTCYIGKEFVRGIARSMYAPIAVLYYNPTATEYRTPRGMVDVKVELKRDIQISDGQLIRILDTYISRPVSGRAARVDMRLAEALTNSRQGSLPDISDTIQPDQYQRIAAEPDCVLLVQGVAGSGKSEIGLHRLAYLLSPHNDLGLNLTVDQVIYIGPSKAFLAYIANLLPDMALDRVKHMTLREWLLTTLPEPVRIERKDALLEAQLSGKKRSLARDTAAASFKVSLKMHRLIDEYVKLQRKGFISKARAVGIDGAFLPASQVARLLRKISARPLNQARSQALRALEAQLSRAMGRTPRSTDREKLSAEVDRFWPEVDFREAYSRLLSDDREMRRLLSRLVPLEASAQLAASLKTRAQLSFKTEDLPALSYMSWAVGPREGRRKSRRKEPPLYRHIVIDEAQDVSPLEHLLISRRSRNHSVTILGDLNQRLLPHRGISSWHEVAVVFGRSRVRRHHVRTSYRSTSEITELANTMLRSLRPRQEIPIPYGRSGDDPRFVQSQSYVTMLAALLSDIDHYLARGMRTVSVLCRTGKEAVRLKQALLGIAAEHGAPSWAADEPDDSRLTISSIYDVKGMEFDAVIIANAGRRNYMASDFHRRLLYIAITRAAHAISIHWFGNLAEPFVALRRS